MLTRGCSYGCSYFGETKSLVNRGSETNNPRRASASASVKEERRARAGDEKEKRSGHKKRRTREDSQRASEMKESERESAAERRNEKEKSRGARDVFYVRNQFLWFNFYGWTSSLIYGAVLTPSRAHGPPPSFPSSSRHFIGSADLAATRRISNISTLRKKKLFSPLYERSRSLWHPARLAWRARPSL